MQIALPSKRGLTRSIDGRDEAPTKRARVEAPPLPRPLSPVDVLSISFLPEPTAEGIRIDEESEGAEEEEVRAVEVDAVDPVDAAYFGGFGDEAIGEGVWDYEVEKEEGQRDEFERQMNKEIEESDEEDEVQEDLEEAEEVVEEENEEDVEEEVNTEEEESDDGEAISPPAPLAPNLIPRRLRAQKMRKVDLLAQLFSFVQRRGGEELLQKKKCLLVRSILVVLLVNCVTNCSHQLSAIERSAGTVEKIVGTAQISSDT
jgi:hypothetical protein